MAMLRRHGRTSPLRNQTGKKEIGIDTEDDAGSFSRLFLFDVDAKIQIILREKELTIKENDHVTSRNT